MWKGRPDLLLIFLLKLVIPLGSRVSGFSIWTEILDSITTQKVGLLAGILPGPGHSATGPKAGGHPTVPSVVHHQESYAGERSSACWGQSCLCKGPGQRVRALTFLLDIFFTF